MVRPFRRGKLLKDPQKTVPQETPWGQVKVTVRLGQTWLPGVADEEMILAVLCSQLFPLPLPN